MWESFMNSKNRRAFLVKQKQNVNSCNSNSILVTAGDNTLSRIKN